MGTIIFGISFCLLLVCIIIILGCQIHVASKLTKGGYIAGNVYRKLTAISSFVKGWKHAKELGITGIMTLWSGTISFTVFLGFVVLISGVLMMK